MDLVDILDPNSGLQLARKSKQIVDRYEEEINSDEQVQMKPIVKIATAEVK